MKSFKSAQNKFKYSFGLDGKTITLTPNLSANVVLTIQTLSEDITSTQFGYVTNNLFGKHKKVIMETLSLQQVVELLTDIIESANSKDNTPSGKN